MDTWMNSVMRLHDYSSIINNCLVESSNDSGLSNIPGLKVFLKPVTPRLIVFVLNPAGTLLSKCLFFLGSVFKYNS